MLRLLRHLTKALRRAIVLKKISHFRNTLSLFHYLIMRVRRIDGQNTSAGSVN